MVYEYIIPQIPPSMNRYLGKNNRYEYARAKEEWARIIKYACLKKPTKPIVRSKVTITYYFPDGRKRDPDNYSGKFLLDALQRAGIIEDDSFNNIELSLRATFKNGSKNQRTVIQVQELGGGEDCEGT